MRSLCRLHHFHQFVNPILSYTIESPLRFVVSGCKAVYRVTRTIGCLHPRSPTTGEEGEGESLGCTTSCRRGSVGTARACAIPKRDASVVTECRQNTHGHEWCAGSVATRRGGETVRLVEYLLTVANDNTTSDVRRLGRKKVCVRGEGQAADALMAVHWRRETAEALLVWVCGAAGFRR